MADGDPSAREATRAVGRDRRGHRHGRRDAGLLAGPLGRRVLFVEKGRSTLPGTAGTIRAAIPELAEPKAYRSAEAYYDALARAGRTTDEIEDISGRFLSGTCRLSAAARVDPRPCTAWSANDSSPKTSLPGKTFATPGIHRARGLAHHL